MARKKYYNSNTGTYLRNDEELRGDKYTPPNQSRAERLEGRVEKKETISNPPEMLVDESEASKTPLTSTSPQTRGTDTLSHR